MSADFIDSNIFIYLFDSTDPRKQGIAERLIEEALRDGTSCVSFQVVQETLNVVTGKLLWPMADAQKLLEDVLMPLLQVLPSQALYQRTLEIRELYAYSFYDSLIIAAALKAGAARLYSEDLQAGQRIEQLIITNPFASIS